MIIWVIEASYICRSLEGIGLIEKVSWKDGPPIVWISFSLIFLSSENVTSFSARDVCANRTVVWQNSNMCSYTDSYKALAIALHSPPLARGETPKDWVSMAEFPTDSYFNLSTI